MADDNTPNVDEQPAAEAIPTIAAAPSDDNKPEPKIPHTSEVKVTGAGAAIAVSILIAILLSGLGLAAYLTSDQSDNLSQNNSVELADNTQSDDTETTDTVVDVEAAATAVSVQSDIDAITDLITQDESAAAEEDDDLSDENIGVE